MYEYSSRLSMKQLLKEFERYKKNVNALINSNSKEHWIDSHLPDSLYVYFDLFSHKQVNSLSYWKSFYSNLDLPNMVGGSSDVTKYIKKYYALKTPRCVLKFITGQSHLFFDLGFPSQMLTTHRTTIKRRGWSLFLSVMYFAVLWDNSPTSQAKRKTSFPCIPVFNNF